MQHEYPDRPRRGAVVTLTVVTVVLWAVAIGLPTLVLVLIARLSGDDPERLPRALLIAAGWFLAPAVLATAATVGLVLVRRLPVGPPAGRHGAGR